MNELILSSIKEFVSREVKPLAERIDREDWYPRELVSKMGEQGFLAPLYEGLSLEDMAVIINETAKVSGSLALIQDAQGELVVEPLRVYSDDKKLVEELAKGKLIGAFGLSEPCCGSDVASMATRAERVNGKWIIRGKKMWITQGLYADIFLIAAKTGDNGLKSITLFLVPRSRCIKTNKIEVMGNRGTGTAEVEINDCEAEEVVGEVNGGWKIIKYALLVGRIAISSIALGLAEGAIEELVQWAENRRVFGTRLIEKQGIQWRLSKIIANLTVAKRFLLDVVRNISDVISDEGKIAVLKFFSAKVANEVIDEALQLMGGMGYAKGTRVERAYRDVRLTRIGEGTDEVQLEIIFKVLKKHGVSYFFSYSSNSYSQLT
jgi:alkylation response protein AidB-like acyl-CoA dehydrogenase